MKIHKSELAQQQLEKQKGIKGEVQEKNNKNPVLEENLNLGEEIDVHFQENMGPDFTQVFNEQLQVIESKEKDFLEQSIPTEAVSGNYF